MSETKGREFEIAAAVTELMDTLTKEQQQQLMSLLNTRYSFAPKKQSYIQSANRFSPRKRPRS
jgi:hypothetical protein